MGQKPDPLTFDSENRPYQAGMRPPTLPDDGGLAPTAKAEPSNLGLKSSLDMNDGTVDPEARAAREEIERTRGQMSETIDQISERLDPEVLTQQAKSAVRNATIGKLEDTVGAAATKMRDAGARVQGVVSTAGDNLGDVASRARTAAVPAVGAGNQTARTVGAAAIRTGRSWAVMIRAHPLPAAALGFGLGCVLTLGIQKLRGPETVSADSGSTAGTYSWNV